MKKTVLRELLKERELENLIPKTLKDNRKFAQMGVHTKQHSKPKRVKKGEE